MCIKVWLIQRSYVLPYCYTTNLFTISMTLIRCNCENSTVGCLLQTVCSSHFSNLHTAQWLNLNHFQLHHLPRSLSSNMALYNLKLAHHQPPTWAYTFLSFKHDRSGQALKLSITLGSANTSCSPPLMW